ADLRTFEGDKTGKARKVGELVAQRAKDAGVEAVVFDRGGNAYHGRVQAIAEGAREGGLALRALKRTRNSRRLLRPATTTAVTAPPVAAARVDRAARAADAAKAVDAAA